MRSNCVQWFKYKKFSVLGTSQIQEKMYKMHIKKLTKIRLQRSQVERKDRQICRPDIYNSTGNERCRNLSNQIEDIIPTKQYTIYPVKFDGWLSEYIWSQFQTTNCELYLRKLYISAIKLLSKAISYIWAPLLLYNFRFSKVFSSIQVLVRINGW